ncbi:beta-aspartyl-peptidase (threonine type) [Sphingomonas laterariae]|uniref:Isoaspartyl peptidase n=1 Tax=Edaphosphingomonas laterariae TaxID=861865 RepID=A0A239FW02_9SPHN|nr:isoaspartyl peptidase/L-asparaginase [Sphingomonas laterariae]SNS60352.1 beta-aspartyl-peptidase (threonine type) [Sphingomonas laterariae]
MTAAADAPRWTIVIHGGSGSMRRGHLPDDYDAGGRAGLKAALDAGTAILAGGGTALDAVEAAIRVLEDDPHFNAGRGSVFTAEGRIECDAAIMDGATRNAGAVAGVRTTRNPITLARAVMDQSHHVFLAGTGADGFARAHDIEAADPAWFETAERRRQLDEILANPDAPFDSAMKYGTVGAVALDSHGHVAAATSTGGLTGKKWGRVGDSPLIGAGTYADDRACAVSCTGSGEMFIRLGVAHEITARVRLAGESIEDAADELIAELTEMGGKGGVIVVSADGSGGWAFNTPGMYRAIATHDSPPEIAIYSDE